jgi:hypothetical protein
MSEKEQQNYRYDVETGKMNQNGTYSTETKKYEPGITNPSFPFYIIKYKITDDTYDEKGNLIPGGKEEAVKSPVTLIETENSKKARYLYNLEPKGPKFRRTPGYLGVTIPAAPVSAPAAPVSAPVAPVSAPVSAKIK